MSLEEPYELNAIKRQRLNTALLGRVDALPPGRMDSLEDLHLVQALRESTKDSDEHEQQRADEHFLLTSTAMKPLLQTHILGFLSLSDWMAMAAVDSNLNQAVELYAERQHRANPPVGDDLYERFLQLLARPPRRAQPIPYSRRNRYRRMIEPANRLAQLRTDSEHLPYRCKLHATKKQRELMGKLHQSDWDDIFS